MPLMTLTYTGVIGPAVTATAVVYTNVQQVNYDWEKMVLNIVYQSGKTSQVTLTGVTTVTTSVSAKTVTIS